MPKFSDFFRKLPGRRQTGPPGAFGRLGKNPAGGEEMFVQSDKNCQKQVLSWKKPLDKIMSRAIIQTTILSTLAMKRDDGEKAVPFLLTESRRMV